MCLQEPNVKESAGGLRDLHAVLWVGHARFGVPRRRRPSRRRASSPARVRRPARRAYDYLSRVRNEAHFATGRKTDLLTLDLQPTLAANLGYARSGGLLASELFMRDYYQPRLRAAPLLRGASCSGTAPLPSRRTFASASCARPPPRGASRSATAALFAQGDRRVPRQRRCRMLEAFALAQAEGARASRRAEARASAPACAWSTARFRASREAARAS